MLLKETASRRRGGRSAWAATVSAAKCLGATVTWSPLNDDGTPGPPLLELPEQVCGKFLAFLSCFIKLSEGFPMIVNFLWRCIS
jgi:hypothetical protein